MILKLWSLFSYFAVPFALLCWWRYLWTSLQHHGRLLLALNTLGTIIIWIGIWKILEDVSILPMLGLWLGSSWLILKYAKNSQATNK